MATEEIEIRNALRATRAAIERGDISEEDVKITLLAVMNRHQIARAALNKIAERMMHETKESE